MANASGDTVRVEVANPSVGDLVETLMAEPHPRVRVFEVPRKLRSGMFAEAVESVAPDKQCQVVTSDDDEVEVVRNPQEPPAKKQRVKKEKPEKRKAPAEVPISQALREVGGRKVVNGVLKGTSQALVEMIDSTPEWLSGQHAALYERYREHGYVLLRGALPAQAVYAARDRILKHLEALGALDPTTGEITKGQAGWTVDSATGEVISGQERHASTTADSQEAWRAMCNDPELQEVVSGGSLRAALKSLCRGRGQSEAPVINAHGDVDVVGKSDKADDGAGFQPLVLHPLATWLRIKSRKELTAEHADLLYFRDLEPYSGLFAHMTDDVAPVEQGAGPLPRVDWEDIVCRVCGDGEPEADLVMCDECDFAQHRTCVDEEEVNLPPRDAEEGEEWFCPNCHPRPELGTAWIPLDDIEPAQGVLCVQPGTHTLPNFFRADEDKRLPLSYGGRSRGRPWHSTRFKAGDLVLFDMCLVHTSSWNHTNRFRLSMDTRFILRPDRPNWGRTTASCFAELLASNKVVFDKEGE